MRLMNAMIAIAIFAAVHTASRATTAPPKTAATTMRR